MFVCIIPSQRKDVVVWYAPTLDIVYLRWYRQLTNCCCVWPFSSLFRVPWMEGKTRDNAPFLYQKGIWMSSFRKEEAAPRYCRWRWHYSAIYIYVNIYIYKYTCLGSEYLHKYQQMYCIPYSRQGKKQFPHHVHHRLHHHTLTMASLPWHPFVPLGFWSLWRLWRRHSLTISLPLGRPKWSYSGRWGPEIGFW